MLESTLTTDYGACSFSVAFRNGYKFTGKERDGESNLDEFGARYYASSPGRFMIPDWATKPTAVPYAHFGNPQSLNLYSYVQNNPTTLGDPDGHADLGGGGGYIGDALGYYNCLVGSGPSGCASANSSQSSQAQKVQNPFNPTITYDKNLSAKDLAADQSKVGAAVGVINSNWSKLSDQEKATLGNIKSIDVSGSAQRSYVQESTGKLTLTQDYVSKSSKAWLASAIGHDGEHVALFNSGGIGASRGLPAEVKAMQFQLQVGTKFGLSATETKYLQGLIHNPSQLKQYINTPP